MWNREHLLAAVRLDKLFVVAPAALPVEQIKCEMQAVTVFAPLPKFFVVVFVEMLAEQIKYEMQVATVFVPQVKLKLVVNVAQLQRLTMLAEFVMIALQ